MKRAAELVDRALDRRALVFGSVPPGGRDLDLLVEPAEQAPLERALEAAGFERRGPTWARFRGCGVEPIDVVPLARWALPRPAEDSLLAEAVPVQGYLRLVRPSARHALLVLARRTARDGQLDEKRRRRVDAALAEDHDAWAGAAMEAPAWGAAAALRLLRRFHRSGATPRRGDRAGAVAEELIAAGASAGSARARAWRIVAPRPRWGRLIALSGLDGSGKSSQAAALAHTLRRLGHDQVVVWNRLGYGRSLDVVAAPVKAALRRVRPGAALPGSEPGRSQGDPARELRRRSALLTGGWSAVVAMANASAHLRATLPHLSRGRVVICDRFVLDSVVHLRFMYARGAELPAHAVLIRRLSPTPTRAYFLDVDPGTAFSRKGEYDPERLDALARPYRGAARDLGVRRLDGERTREDLCAEIGADAWRALS